MTPAAAHPHHRHVAIIDARHAQKIQSHEGGEVKHTALYNVGKRSGDVLWLPATKGSTPGCSLLNQPRRHITAQPRTPPVPATNSVAPLPSLLLPRPVSSVQVPRKGEEKSPPSKPCTHTNKIHSLLVSIGNTNTQAKPTTPTSQDLNSTRQHQAELSCLLPPAPRVSPSRVLPSPHPSPLSHCRPPA